MKMLDLKSMLIGSLLTFIAYKMYFKWRRRAISLENKTIVITGASSGIGRGLAYYLKEYNVNLFLCARSIKLLEKIRDEFVHVDSSTSQRLKSLHCIHLDLSSEQSISSAFNQIRSHTDQVDILINNAGVSSRQLCTRTLNSVYREVMEYRSTLPLSLEFLTNGLLNKNEGTIVSVGSVQSFLGIPERSAYASSKFALRGFFDCLRAEIKSTYGDVRVITAHPSYVATNLSLNAITATGCKHNRMDENTSNGMSVDVVAKKIVDVVTDWSSTQELVITPQWKIQLAIAARNIFPDLVFKLVSSAKPK